MVDIGEPLPPTGERTVTATDGEDLNKAAAKALAASGPDVPTLDSPPSDLVHLPGGMIVKGEQVKTAVVRELTGEHEEKMARALASGTFFHFVDTLLACGTAQIGETRTEVGVQRLLKQMLLGDRSALLVAIRKATYGPEMGVQDRLCGSCGERLDVTLNLDDDVTVKELAKTTDAEFEVKLSRDRTARVRLANGEDQGKIFADSKLVAAEQNTILLQQCVHEIEDAAGLVKTMAGFPALAKQLGLRDRRALIKELGERQPGPELDAVKVECPSCGEEVVLGIGVEDLFRGE